MDRVVWTATGTACAFRSLLEFAAPQYYHPVSPLDYLAVWSYTVALLLSAPAIVALARLSPSRSAHAVAIVAATGAVAAGVANALEDALRLLNASLVYSVGTLAMFGGMLALVVVLAVVGSGRLAAAFGVWWAGFLLASAAPGGGVVIIAILVAVALWPSWFAGRDRPATP